MSPLAINALILTLAIIGALLARRGNAWGLALGVLAASIGVWGKP